MTKQEFLFQLTDSLSGLHEDDIKKSLDYYTEMIDDRIEDGMAEEDAVAAVGTIEEIRSKILEDVPMARIVKEKITPKRDFKAGEIVLLVLGAPIWLPLLLAFIIVGLALYLVFWVIIMSLYVVDLSVFVSGFAAIAGAFFASNGFMAAMFFIGAGLFLLGLSVLLFFGFNQVSKGMLFLSKHIGLGIKKAFVGGR
ncbi:DUF1700 domain-containing protein [Butyrivibrio sp. DSM 10294]|uniref:DUF1700 domain-containing protein n=1 Tax=Butyrivibrio sp. DSM 10294 TaxID=2972457 RepID=UPI00234F7CFB|nr:DUF1700 domain-containing protein [Butyrivibrio sp. DSM 10294]MDC7294775.1 DUF1700 domain-containing protein [Butyrivibrio sp. DSM 10294]